MNRRMLNREDCCPLCTTKLQLSFQQTFSSCLKTYLAGNSYSIGQTKCIIEVRLSLPKVIHLLDKYTALQLKLTINENHSTSRRLAIAATI
jgi:hypothetical protein